MENDEDLDVSHVLNLLESQTNKIGPGYKTCVCGKVIPARQKVCSCGSSESQTKEKVVTTVSSRGRKQCKCGAFIGVRNEICPSCGDKFEKKEVKNEDGNRKIPNRYVGGRIILTPAGDCPYKLKTTDEESVFSWCEDILEYGRLNKVTYSIDAMIYWLRDSFCLRSEEFKQAKEQVLAWDKLCEQSQKKNEEESNCLENLFAIFANENLE